MLKAVMLLYLLTRKRFITPKEKLHFKKDYYEMVTEDYYRTANGKNITQNQEV